MRGWECGRGWEDVSVGRWQRENGKMGGNDGCKDDGKRGREVDVLRMKDKKRDREEESKKTK